MWQIACQTSVSAPEVVRHNRRTHRDSPVGRRRAGASASWAASALRMLSWMSPMRRTRSGSASSFSEALTAIAFDHARIHPSLGLSKLRLDNVIEHHCDDMGDGSRCTAEVFKSRHSI